MNTTKASAEPQSAPTYRRKREAALWIDQRLRQIVDETITKHDFRTALQALSLMRGLGDEV